jgi:predicted phosphodiesterase
MDVQYLSDVHLEFMQKLPKIKVMADVLCLAGDIGYPFSGIYREFLIKMNSNFKKVFIITGNHEYYNINKYGTHTIDEINRMIESIIYNHKLTNVTFLNNSYEVYNDVIFAGTTLWSKIPSVNMNDICLMNDFKAIENMTFDTFNILHNESCNFIENLLTKVVSEHTGKKIVMMTHHLPSFDLINGRYKYENTNCFYASSSERFFVEPIKAWIYGHTHIPSKKIINDIQFVCNPKGYPNENTIINYETINI